MGIDTSRARLAIFDASTGTERRTVRPLHPVVLVAAELLGFAAEVAGVVLLRSHGDCLEGRCGLCEWYLGEGVYSV